MKQVLGGVFFWLLFTSGAQAATLYIDPNTANLSRGDAITIAIRLDTDEASGECINAVDGVITYSESIVPVDVSVGRSIFPVWVEAPVINKENRTITFAGGIPNGYCGRVEGDPGLTNVITELVFRAPGLQVGGGEASKVADIQFAPETTVYMNDGQGTQANLQTFGSQFTISNSTGSEIIDDWRLAVLADSIPPEEFSIALEHGNKEFNGKYYIVFNTTDKQTGISHYEVIEESDTEVKLFNFGAANAPWTRVPSPYVLKDQTLRSTIRVKAVDKAGNEYIATFVPDKSLQTGVNTMFINIFFIGIGLVVFTTIAFFTWFLVKRQRRKMTVGETDDLSVTQLPN